MVDALLTSGKRATGHPHCSMGKSSVDAPIQDFNTLANGKSVCEVNLRLLPSRPHIGASTFPASVCASGSLFTSYGADGLFPAVSVKTCLKKDSICSRLFF